MEKQFLNDKAKIMSFLYDIKTLLETSLQSLETKLQKYEEELEYQKNNLEQLLKNAELIIKNNQERETIVMTENKSLDSQVKEILNMVNNTNE